MPAATHPNLNQTLGPIPMTGPEDPKEAEIAREIEARGREVEAGAGAEAEVRVKKCVTMKKIAIRRRLTRMPTRTRNPVATKSIQNRRKRGGGGGKGEREERERRRRRNEGGEKKRRRRGEEKKEKRKEEKRRRRRRRETKRRVKQEQSQIYGANMGLLEKRICGMSIFLFCFVIIA